MSAWLGTRRRVFEELLLRRTDGVRTSVQGDREWKEGGCISYAAAALGVSTVPAACGQCCTDGTNARKVCADGGADGGCRHTLGAGGMGVYPLYRL